MDDVTAPEHFESAIFTVIENEVFLKAGRTVKGVGGGTQEVEKKTNNKRIKKRQRGADVVHDDAFV